MADNDVNESFKTVTIVNSEEEANIVVGFLQANGVDASVESLHSSEFPAEVGRLSEVRINAPAAQAEEAFRLLRETEQQSGSPTTTETVGSDVPPRPAFEG
jgi:hypothetical protein